MTRGGVIGRRHHCQGQFTDFQARRTLAGRWYYSQYLKMKILTRVAELSFEVLSLRPQEESKSGSNQRCRARACNQSTGSDIDGDPLCSQVGLTSWGWATTKRKRTRWSKESRDRKWRTGQDKGREKGNEIRDHLCISPCRKGIEMPQTSGPFFRQLCIK